MFYHVTIYIASKAAYIASKAAYIASKVVLFEVYASAYKYISCL